MNKHYVLYDSRALSQETEDCSVAVVSSSSAKAKVDSKDFPDDYVWYEYDVKDGDFINEKLWKTNGQVKEVVNGNANRD